MPLPAPWTRGGFREPVPRGGEPRLPLRGEVPGGGDHHRRVLSHRVSVADPASRPRPLPPLAGPPPGGRGSGLPAPPPPPARPAAGPAGFRACKRCRPDRLDEPEGALVGRALRLIAAGLADGGGIGGVAPRLGVSSRTPPRRSSSPAAAVSRRLVR